MSSAPTNSLSEFHRFIGAKIDAGQISLSPEEALDEWQNLQHSQELDALDHSDFAAIQEAVDALDRGDRGIPFEEFDQAFRKRHNIPDNA